MQHIITIAGRPGSGKSTTAKMVAKKLGYDHFSSGDYFRQLSKDYNVDLLSGNLLAEKHSELDVLVDKKLRQLAEDGDKIVVDSRMAWHWMPQSFKVFLDLDMTTAAERILQNVEDRASVNENIPDNVSDYSKKLRERLESEKRRYKVLYNCDPFDTDNYDLVVDTKANDIEHVVSQIIVAFNKWRKDVV